MPLLFRDFHSRVEIRSSREGILRFHRHSEAVSFLRRNAARPGVIAALRQVLSQQHHVQVWRLSDEGVLEEVARRLMGGSLQLLETFEPRIEAPSTVEEEAEAEPEAEIAPPPAPPPLLPMLEEVQIEGAEVLPEITQTLEQIDLTIGGIGTATVSLEPAPSGVPKISTAMSSASDSITSTLGGL